MTVKRALAGEPSSRNNMASPSGDDESVTMAEEASASSSSSRVTTPHQVMPVQSLSVEERENLMAAMLERLAATPAHFAHQQRDMPDLTVQEKANIAFDILDKSPSNFLARFGKFLCTSDLPFFHEMEKDNYEIRFYLKEIRHRCSHAQVIVKNRRYLAMKELERGGVYFSDQEMKRREPLLHEQMVGQFLSEEQQQQQCADTIDRTDLKFSTILLGHMDIVQERALYRIQKETEECQEEEEEEEDSEEEDDDEENATEMEEEVAEDVPEISGERVTGIWKQHLTEEFKAIMHEKFMSGDDSQFDYSQVDDNPDYDSLETVTQDEEQTYFLSEDPHAASDSDRDSNNHEPSKKEEEEEEDDYMMYEPSPDLVTKSARFVTTGCWKESDEVQDV